jgi:oligopeptide/dipeptide ABC transporter ATP-binding protein
VTSLEVAPMLDVQGLCSSYSSSRSGFGRKAEIRVLDGLNLTIQPGETLGLVGESGCGKTTLLLSILRLVSPHSGRVMLDSEDILSSSGTTLRRLRRDVQVVFQNPFSSLDPHMSVLELIGEPLRLQGSGNRAARRSTVKRLLDDVGLGEEYLGSRPGQLSGGQAQRVAIARAIALRPRLLLLDEPTSSLDVSVQAQILNLLMALQQKHEMTYLFVSHDLRVIRHVSDRIAVMYLGEIVEQGGCEDVLAAPAHPYTQALLAAGLADEDKQGDETPKGDVPAFTNPPEGCRFHPRCPYVMDVCRTTPPTASTVRDRHEASCHLIDRPRGNSTHRDGDPPGGTHERRR